MPLPHSYNTILIRHVNITDNGPKSSTDTASAAGAPIVDLSDATAFVAAADPSAGNLPGNGPGGAVHIVDLPDDLLDVSDGATLAQRINLQPRWLKVGRPSTANFANFANFASLIRSCCPLQILEVVAAVVGVAGILVGTTVAVMGSPPPPPLAPW
jgi:hypothetical protein